MLHVVDRIDEPFLALNGDRIIDPGVVDQLIDADANGEQVMTVTRSSTPSDYGVVELDGRQVDLGIDLPTKYLQSLEEVQLVACGTSYHAALYTAQVVEAHGDVRASASFASEYEFTGGRDP